MQVQENYVSSKKRHHYSMQECIENCLNCFTACEMAIVHMVKRKQFESDHFAILKSCAEICQTSAKFMMMNSPFHELTCGVCSKICSECADSCESMNVKYLSECIQACRRCAESCGQMSSAVEINY